MKKKANNNGKSGSKVKKPSEKSFLLQSSTFFLTFKGISDIGEKITKFDLANFLTKSNPSDRKLYPEKYMVCEQSYDDGTPHFHVILVYPKRKQVLHPDYYNYLGIHPNIQTMYFSGYNFRSLRLHFDR